MHPSDANRIQTFIETVLQPAFANIQATLASAERIITLIRNTESLTESSAAVLHQMHPETPYFASSPSPPSSAQTQIIGSLYVEILQHPEPAPICIGQYCLSIEITTQPTAPIEITSILGFTNANAKTNDKKLETQRTAFKDDHHRLDLEEIDDSEITLHFIESFDAFEHQLLASEATLLELPEATTPTAPEQPLNVQKPSHLPPDLVASPLISSKAQPEPIPETSPLTPEAPSLSKQPISHIEPEAAIAKLHAAQRQSIEPLLSYLKQSQKTFRAIWTSDLARGAALAEKIIKEHPDPESDYQQAYDLLSTQASEFAWTFKPNSLSEFADHFELYWSMAERASILTAEQENKPYRETFITQIQALGEPDNPSQTKAVISNALRSLVRSISRKFGYPSEPGKLNWIGRSDIHSFTSIEHMIRLIQDQNEKRQVLFETLSWGVLQVYQNADDLPELEHKLGNNLVLSYFISAKQTIRNPTQPVEIDRDSIEHYEFVFKRKIEDKQRVWLATARVRVTHAYHQVNLYGYGIEEHRAPKRAEIE